MDQSPQPFQKFFNSLFVIAFLLFMAIPLIGLALGWEKGFEEAEGRAFTKFPSTTVSTIYRDGWREGVDNFVNDRFGLRGRLIQWNNSLTFNVLHSAPLIRDTTQLAGTTRSPNENIPDEAQKPEPVVSTQPTEIGQPSPSAEPWVQNKVVTGKEGWYFYDFEGVVDNYRCIHPFTDLDLQHIGDRLVQDQATLAAQGIKFYLLLVPDKHSVYPEYLPDTIQRIGQQCRYDQLVKYLADHTTIPVVDSYPLLMKEKSQHQIYEKTGTHWNALGAFVAYRALMQIIKKDFPAIQPHDWSEYTITSRSEPGADLAKLLGLQNTLQETMYRLEPKFTPVAYETTVAFTDPNPDPGRNPWPREVDNQHLPRALILRDSFFNRLSPFIVEHFRRSVSVWTYEVLPELITAEKPDVVILEIVSRKLGELR